MRVLGAAHPSHPPYTLGVERFSHTGTIYPVWVSQLGDNYVLTGASLIVRTNIDRKLGIVGLLTLLPVFNKSISVLVAPRLARHCHRSVPDVNYLSVWTQVRRRRRGPRPQVTSAPVPVRSALVIITHITITGPRLFSRHHESLLSDRRLCYKFLNIILPVYRRNFENIAPPCISEEPGS